MRTIGEVAAETGVAPHILRYWEQNVAALRPVRRAGGRRYFRAEDVALIRHLQRLMHEEGYTLEGAARAVRASRRGDDAPVAASPASSAPPSALGNDAMLPQHLQRIRARLQSALDKYDC